MPPTQGLASRPFLTILLYTIVVFYIFYSSLLRSTLPFRIGLALLPEHKQKQMSENLMLGRVIIRPKFKDRT